MRCPTSHLWPLRVFSLMQIKTLIVALLLMGSGSRPPQHLLMLSQAVLNISFSISASPLAGRSTSEDLSLSTWIPPCPTDHREPISKVASPNLVPGLQRRTSPEPFKEAGVPLATEAGMTTFSGSLQPVVGLMEDGRNRQERKELQGCQGQAFCCFCLPTVRCTCPVHL